MSELLSPFRVWRVDEGCNLLSAWSTALSGSGQQPDRNCGPQLPPQFETTTGCGGARLLVVGNGTFTAYCVKQAPLLLNCEPQPASIVGFWPLEGDGDDLVGCSNGTDIGSPGRRERYPGKSSVPGRSTARRSTSRSPTRPVWTWAPQR